jgi:hypothetical protein
MDGDKKTVNVTQKADLNKPIAHNGEPPFYIRTLCTKMSYTDAGVMPQNKVEDYILISSLPDDLKDRVKTFIQAKLAGGR